MVNLKKLFERLRKFQLKLNPAKCTFGVTFGKLLGFVVNKKGIEIDPDKVSNTRFTSSPNPEGSNKFYGKIELHSSIHLSDDG